MAEIDPNATPNYPAPSRPGLNPTVVEVHIRRDLCRVERENGEYGGYKKDILKENLSDRESVLFICEVCDGIMREACLTGNGEQSCSCCGVQDPNSQNIFKIFYKTYLCNLSKLTPNVAVRKMVNSLKCSCPLIDRGCEWVGTLEDCEEHLETCGYVRDECRLGCKRVLQRNELKDHEMEDCPEGEIRCELCSQKLISRELSTHLEMCPKVEVSCELCVKKICREYMTQHLEQDCAEKEIECPFAKYKCEVTSIKRKYLNQHLEEKRIEHLELKLAATEDLVKEQNKKIEKLKKNNCIISN